MKFIAKEDFDCAFGILKVGESFEADAKDERVAQLMVDGKIVSAEPEAKPEPKTTRKNAKKAEKVEEPEAEEATSDEE